MKRSGKRTLSLVLAVLVTLSAGLSDTAMAAQTDTVSEADASGDASETEEAAISESTDDEKTETAAEEADASSVSTLSASAAAYSCSYTYTTLNDVTLTPSTETVSAVSTALLSFLQAYEGDYDSVNADDSGALSIGILQWHGANALTLMRLIVSEDNETAYDALGDSLYNEVISSSTSWSSRTLSSTEKSAVSACIATTAGKSVQDQLAASYVAGYINTATSLGIRNASAILIYGDVANQRGSSGAATTAAAAAALAGSYGAVTGNEMLIAAIGCYPTTSSYYTSFVKRRLACYQTAVDLGWEYKQSGDYLIPTSQTKAENTAVSWVQNTLNLVSSASLTVNGTYDSATIAAVTAFQTLQGLDADGETGVYTIAALIEALYSYMTDGGYTTASLILSSSSSSGTSSSTSDSSSSSDTSSSTSSGSSSTSSSTSAASTLKISSYTYPTTIKKGSSFTLKGTIKSNYSITKVTVKVINSSGKTVLSASASPKSTSYKIQTALDAKIKFGSLAAGTYTYQVTATDTKQTKTLISRTFKVRSLTISSTKYPTSIKKGKSFTIKGTIKSSYKITKVTVQILDSDGNVVQSATAKPNKKSYKIQTKLDAKIKFGKLSKGTYTYKVIASDTKTSNVTLLSKTFKVK